MTGDGSVHQLFESQTGRLVLVCRDTETFERLRAALCREANVALSIDIPPAPVRSVSLELAQHVEPAAVSWRNWLTAWGCGALLSAGFIVFVIGVMTILGWVKG